MKERSCTTLATFDKQSFGTCCQAEHVYDHLFWLLGWLHPHRKQTTPGFEWN